MRTHAFRAASGTPVDQTFTSATMQTGWARALVRRSGASSTCKPTSFGFDFSATAESIYTRELILRPCPHLTRRCSERLAAPIHIYHEIPCPTRSWTLSRQPSLILFSLDAKAFRSPSRSAVLLHLWHCPLAVRIRLSPTWLL